MSADTSDHSHDAVAGHDLAAEAQHAREHAVENNKFFAVFLFLVALAVVAYELKGTNPFWITVLAIARCSFIGYFMFSLFRRFNYIFAAFLFTALFFIGMVFLSWWDSTVPGIGDPITNKNDVQISHPH